VPSGAITWLGDRESKPAPAALRRVQALINTIDRESGQDRLATVDDATPWLVANDLLTVGTPISTADLAVVVSVREALRALVVHNAGGPLPSPGALQVLRDIAGSTSARAMLDDDGTVRVEPDEDAPRARLLGVLLSVRDAQADGTWSHLKACANAECQWAFYDRSRNHGGTWCEMATCGNKFKNRDFRARKRG
jgi:predicted RNA-binding Zn ribbon-like protein